MTRNGPPRALREHRCLHYGYQQTGNLWRLKGPDGEHAYPVNCVAWSNNGEALKNISLRHQGIALLPTFIVGDELQLGRLRTILCEYQPQDISVSALFPRHRYLSSKVRLFVDFLTEQLGNRPHWESY